MSNDDLSRNVVQFQPHEQPSEEERNRRVLAEADRLAGLAPGEGLFWCPSSAERLGVAPDQLTALVKDKIAAREKAAAEKLAQDKLGEQRAERERKVEAQKFREKVREEDVAATK